MGAALPEGYKDSSAGLVPVDWDVVAQGDVATFHNGRAYKLSEWEDNGTPVIRLQNLTGTGNEFYYSNLKLPNHQYVDTGELLYMWSATIGPKIWSGEKAIYHYHIWKVACDDKRLDQSFMFQSLLHLTEQMKGQSHGSTMLHLTKAGMEKHLFCLPPLPEQKKIARILSTVDRKLELIGQQITATQTLKKGLMQKLFSEGVGTQDISSGKEGQWQPHTRFKDSELGRIPAGWKASRIGEHVTKVGSGVTPKGGSASYLDEGIPLIRSQNVLFGRLDLSDVAYISDEQHDKMKGSKLNPNDVLLNITGASIGRCCILPETITEANVNQHVCIIRTTEILTSEYTAYFLNSEFGQSQIWSLQAGGNREGLNFQQIRSFKIPVPPVEEQKEIAKILSTADKKLEHLTTQKTQTEQLKKGMMQKLLTGQIRVKPEPQDH